MVIANLNQKLSNSSSPQRIPLCANRTTPAGVGLALCSLIGLLMGGCPTPGPGPGGGSALVALDRDVNTSTDSAITIALSATGANAGDILTFLILSLPANGTLSDPNAGAITTVPYSLSQQGDEVRYTSQAGFAGEDSFTYAANIGQVQSASAAVTITVAELEPDVTFTTDTTVSTFTVEEGQAALIADNAILTVTGDATIDGTLFAESGRIRMLIEGDLTINGTIRAVNADASPDDDAALSDQPTGIILLVGTGAVTLGPNAVLNSNGPVVVTDDETFLARTPTEVFDEVEDVSGDDLPSLVPLPPDDPAFSENGPPKVKVAPISQVGALPPVTVSGTWPPAGAPPPPGDRPVIILRFNGSRDLNLDNWTVNGPGAPAGASADQTTDPGENATGTKGKDGLRLNIRNNGGPINIVNNVVLNLANGGDGGNATSECATATGGAGGNSGNFRMTGAGGIDMTRGTLTINPGRGGNGGSARVQLGEAGAAGCPGEAGRSGTAVGGKGGDNRKRLFVRGNVAGLENVVIGPLSGGGGGSATAFACDGGPGDPCCDGGAGGEATATGGRGGDATLAVGGLGVTTSPVTAGDGGDATAFGGNGGDGGDCKLDDGGNGGAGGGATATGANGGSASNDSGPATGGNGGNADALGGDGGNGGDSGLGVPGAGGAGGVGIAIEGGGGTATTPGADGEPTQADGDPGEDGGAIVVFLFCFDFGFLVDESGVVEPGTHDGIVTDPTTGEQIGAMSIALAEIPGANYLSSNGPPPHIGLNGGQLDIDVKTLQLEMPLPGAISGLQIEPLFGENVSAQQPLQVQALAADGSLIGEKSFTSVPNNSNSLETPQTLGAEFDVADSVATFRIIVPQGTFVTLIRIYLVDP